MVSAENAQKQLCRNLDFNKETHSSSTKALQPFVDDQSSLLENRTSDQYGQFNKQRRVT